MIGKKCWTEMIGRQLWRQEEFSCASGFLLAARNWIFRLGKRCAVSSILHIPIFCYISRSGLHDWVMIPSGKSSRSQWVFLVPSYFYLDSITFEWNIGVSCRGSKLHNCSSIKLRILNFVQLVNRLPSISVSFFSPIPLVYWMLVDNNYWFHWIIPLHTHSYALHVHSRSIQLACGSTRVIATG